MVASSHNIVIAKKKRIGKNSVLAEIWPKPISDISGWIAFLFNIPDVCVKRSIAGTLHPFGTVFNAYYCSTVSGLHVDKSYHPQLASEQTL